MPRFYDPTFVYSGKQKNFLDTEVSNEDTDDATYQYYGWVNPRTGAWVIQRFHILTNAVIYEYAMGRDSSDYVAAWNWTTGRYVGEFTFYKIHEVVQQ